MIFDLTFGSNGFKKLFNNRRLTITCINSTLKLDESERHQNVIKLGLHLA